jgi:hypothetical protein
MHPVFSEGVLMKCQRILPDRENQRELVEAIKMVQMTKGDGNLFSVMRLKLVSRSQPNNIVVPSVG